MKILVQWQKQPAEGWAAIDSGEWGGLPNNPLLAVCVQGIVFSSGKIAVEDFGEQCIVTSWQESGVRNSDGSVSTFLDLAPDALLDGDYNTRQVRTFFAGEGKLQAYLEVGVPALGWDQFPYPEEKITRILLSQTVQDKVARRDVTWREWTKGVPLTQLDNKGLVRVR